MTYRRFIPCALKWLLILLFFRFLAFLKTFRYWMSPCEYFNANAPHSSVFDFPHWCAFIYSGEKFFSILLRSAFGFVFLRRYTIVHLQSRHPGSQIFALTAKTLSGYSVWRLYYRQRYITVCLKRSLPVPPTDRLPNFYSVFLVWSTFFVTFRLRCGIRFSNSLLFHLAILVGSQR